MELTEIYNAIQKRAAEWNGDEIVIRRRFFDPVSPEPPLLNTVNFIEPPSADMARRCHYKDISKYHGHDFIRQAYLSILKHSPDPQGEDHYYFRMQKDISRPELVLRLRLSGEGRANRVWIKGFLFPLVEAMILRIPLISYLYKILKNIYNISKQLERQRLDLEKLREEVNRAIVNQDEFNQKVAYSLANIERITHEKEPLHE